MPSDIEIAKAVSEWKRGDTIVDVTDEFVLEVAVIFDHDYEFHILFYEHEHTVSGWGYSFWFINFDGATFLKRWGRGYVPPYVECAQIAQDWREMSVEYSRIESGE